jgi:hypothetical protein
MILLRTSRRMGLCGTPCEIILLCSLLGCSPPYRQPTAGDLATIQTGSDTILISQVDGASTADRPNRVMRGLGFLVSGPNLPIGKSQVFLTPGKHTLQVQSFTAVVDLWLVAEPGGQYLVKSGKSTSRGVPIWIEEERTGKPTGGIKGSADEPGNEQAPPTRPAGVNGGEAS